MAKNKSQKLPKFNSLDKLVEFFETHDMGEYWDEMPETRFEIDIKKRTHFFPLDADLAEKLNEIAKKKKTPSEVLIKSWLKEKILEYA